MIHMYLTKFLKGNERNNLFSENLKHAACSILLQFFFQSKSFFEDSAMPICRTIIILSLQK